MTYNIIINKCQKGTIVQCGAYLYLSCISNVANVGFRHSKEERIFWGNHKAHHYQKFWGAENAELIHIISVFKYKLLFN